MWRHLISISRVVSSSHLEGNLVPNFPWNHKQLLFKLDHITVTWLQGLGVAAPPLLPDCHHRIDIFKADPFQVFLCSGCLARQWAGKRCKWNLRMRNMCFFNKLWPKPKRTHKPSVGVLLIKMGSVLSSPSFFLFLPDPGCMGPISLLSFPGSYTRAMCCSWSKTHGLISTDSR